MLAVIHIVCYHVITVCFKIAVTERKKIARTRKINENLFPVDT